MVFLNPYLSVPDPPDSLISQTWEFKPWGILKCRAVTNEGAYKVISTQMGYNITPHILSMGFSLMDEGGAPRDLIFWGSLAVSFWRTSSNQQPL